MKSSFFIVVDRGNLKAYRAEKVPADRPPRMQLVHAVTLAEAHLKPTEIFTDEAGGFPTQTGAGGRQMIQGNSIAERHYDVENDRRLTKQLAQHIGKILRGQDVESWSFAAPADIHEAIVNQLEPSVRNRIAEHVAADLVKIPASGLLEHFTAVHAT